jgi:hypothetical protein
MCNLGCVAESSWSTYDFNFIINDSFRGIIIPTIKRIRERNEGCLKKFVCNLDYIQDR